MSVPLSSVQQLINLYEACPPANVSANEAFSVTSSSEKDFFFDDPSSESFFFSVAFFSRLLAVFRAHFTALLILEFVSRIFSIFFIISSSGFHSVGRSSSIKK
jgi:hypothetical protein